MFCFCSSLLAMAAAETWVRLGVTGSLGLGLWHVQRQAHPEASDSLVPFISEIRRGKC